MLPLRLPHYLVYYNLKEISSAIKSGNLEWYIVSSLVDRENALEDSEKTSWRLSEHTAGSEKESSEDVCKLHLD